MSEDERWSAPIGPVDPDHPECAAVIAEVWTLLDGECTAETRDKLKHHLDECPTCLRHYGVEERIKTLIAKKCSGEKAPEGPARAAAHRDQPHHDHPSGLAHRLRTAVGPLSVVGLAVLAIALLAATLGHGVPPYGQGVCSAPVSCGRVHYILSRPADSSVHPGLWFDRSR